jgi:hypothetical protein
MEEGLLKLMATTTGRVSVHWIHLAYDGNQRTAVNASLNHLLKDKEFLGQLSDYQIIARKTLLLGFIRLDPSVNPQSANKLLRGRVK